LIVVCTFFSTGSALLKYRLQAFHSQGKFMRQPRCKLHSLTVAVQAALLCSSLALTVPTVSAAPAESAVQAQSFDIAGGPLAEVLNRYASAAGIALSFDATALQGLRSQGLQGTYEVEEGFARLLQDSGLRAVRQGEGIYGLEPQPQQRPVNSDVLELDATQITVSTLRGDTAVGQTSQRVTVIDRQQIEQQLALSSDPGQVLSNLIPSYSPSRQKMSNAGETLRGRTPQFLVDGVPQASSIRNDGRSSYTGLRPSMAAAPLAVSSTSSVAAPRAMASTSTPASAWRAMTASARMA
jgi:iron complex outermembrane receptor protein